MGLNFDPNNPKYEYITDTSAAVDALNKLQEDKIIAVDVEANSLDPYTGDLLLVQIGNEEISYIFDARAIKLQELPEYKSLLEDKSKIKLLQNGKFDYKYLKVKTGVELNNIFDTMLSEALLTAGLGKGQGLSDISNKYIGSGVIDKTLQSSFKDMPKSASISEEQLRYAGADTLILFPIFKEQTSLLNKQQLLNIAKLEFAVTSVVGEMELKGLYINQKRWREIIKDLKTNKVRLEKEFQSAIKPHYKTTQKDLFGGFADAININSQQQLMDLFNNRLNLNLPSTSSAVLSNSSHPIVRLLSEYRGYEKLISSFGDSVLDKINPVTGRIHPDFQQLRTATGRFACSNPNIQQIPAGFKAPFRECFNPEPGYKMVVSDYSSFEMRILAELSGDEKMVQALKDRLDIHSYTASLMFNKPYSDDFKKKFPELRQMAKPIGFGLMYGMGAMGLKNSMLVQNGKEISVEESEDLIQRYFKSYPSVGEFLERQARDALKNGWSSTPGGRKRWYTTPLKSDPEYRRRISSIRRQAKNYPMQGTNADAIKYALVFVHERIKKDNIDASIVMTVHDEIACEVREDQAKDFAKTLSDEMIRAGELFLKNVPVISVPFVGDVWDH